MSVSDGCGLPGQVGVACLNRWAGWHLQHGPWCVFEEATITLPRARLGSVVAALLDGMCCVQAVATSLQCLLVVTCARYQDPYLEVQPPGLQPAW